MKKKNKIPKNTVIPTDTTGMAESENEDFAYATEPQTSVNDGNMSTVENSSESAEIGFSAPDNDSSELFGMADSDVPVIEEVLEYRDIEQSMADSDENRENFEKYLHGVIDSERKHAARKINSSQDRSDSGVTVNAPEKAVASGLRAFLKNTWLYKFFTGYDKYDKDNSESVGKSKNDAEYVENEKLRDVKATFTKIDKAIFERISRNTISRLNKISVKCYGIMFLAYALVSFIYYFIGTIVLKHSAAEDTATLLYGIISMMLATTFMTGDSSISDSFVNNRFTKAIFIDFLGYRLSEKYGKKIVPLKFYQIVIFLILGTLIGLSTLVISANALWFVGCVIAVAALSVSSPEFGFNITVLILPFTGFFEHKTLPIAVLTTMCIVCYLRKLMLRRRSLEFEPIDTCVILFAVVYFISGLTSVTGTPDFSESIISFVLILAYFISANIMRSERSLQSFENVFSASATVVAVLGILEFVSGRANVSWLDLSVFTNGVGRIVSVFGNPNVLAVYLLFYLPFGIAAINRNMHTARIIFPVISSASVIAAIVLTQSRGAYVAMIFTLFASVILMFRNSPKKWIWIAVVLPYVMLLIPQFVYDRFTSVFASKFDSSISYRLLIWQGVLRVIKDHFFFGIGLGTDAFNTVYASYATVGAENAVHAHNTLLQIAVETGLAGITAFLIMLTVFIQLNMSRNEKVSNDIKLSQSSAFIAIISAMIFGAADHIWYDRRMLFLFFVIMGCAVAARRLGKDRAANHTEENSNPSVYNNEFL